MDCRSKAVCQKCEGKHNTSICDREPERLIVAQEKLPVTHPLAAVKVNCVQCRALLNSVADSTYISAALANELKSLPVCNEVRRIGMIMYSANKGIDIYKTELCNIAGTFSLRKEAFKVGKSVLLTLPSPYYSNIINNYTHLQRVKMEDTDKKVELSVHVILGTSNYTNSRHKHSQRLKILENQLLS